MGIQIGPITTRNRVFLAPMSGVSDEPFRALAHRYGAGMVVSEMVASEELVRERPDIMRRTRGAEVASPFVIQLAGREEKWMAEGACIACGLGADVIDINMGCPAREVTGGLSGSALMRDLDHAERLLAATVGAVSVPVTLKMRLGWDHDTINAPELARRAEQAGIALLTVHGRTRCQFYKGRADWKAIRQVRAATSLPLIANGDGATLHDVKAMLAASGADGVMIGRAAYGQPWLIGELAEALEPGSGIAPLGLRQSLAAIADHYRHMLRFYGDDHGVKIARKHLGWYVLHLNREGLIDDDAAGRWRARLVREDSSRTVLARLGELSRQLADTTLRAA